MQLQLRATLAGGIGKCQHNMSPVVENPRNMFHANHSTVQEYPLRHCPLHHERFQTSTHPAASQTRFPFSPTEKQLSDVTTFRNPITTRIASWLINYNSPSTSGLAVGISTERLPLVLLTKKKKRFYLRICLSIYLASPGDRLLLPPPNLP